MNNIGFFKYINGFLIDDATRKIISSNDFERFLLMNDNTIFLKNIKAGISDETKIYAGNVCLKIRVKTFDNEICGVIEESSETASNFIGYWQMEKDAVEGERVLAKYLGYDDIKINDVVVHSSFETEFKEDEFELKVISKNKEFKWILFKKEDDIGMMFDNTSTHELSYVDTITGGLNREGFLNRVEELFYAENEMDYSILYFDIKDFKAINEICGHDGGDELLKYFYKQLNAKHTLNIKLIGRSGADHFVALIRKESVNPQTLMKVCNYDWSINKHNFSISANVGVYNIDEHVPVINMIDRAKLAKESVDSSNHEIVGFYTKKMFNSYIGSTEIINEINKAIEDKKIEIFYQPIVDVKTGHVASAEALVRWKKGRKYVSPSIFIPVLENAGLISIVDFYVVRETYRMFCERDERRLKNVPVSINLSWTDLGNDGIYDILNMLSKTTNRDNKKIRIELTETALAKMDNQKKEVVSSIKHNHLDLLLDDFGSGYSSFNTLSEYDFDILKIDKKFIDNIAVEEKSLKIVMSIINMCHLLGMKVIAEGVENEDQFKILRDLDCDYIQGYYFSQPLDRHEFESLLDNQ